MFGEPGKQEREKVNGIDSEGIEPIEGAGIKEPAARAKRIAN